MAETLRELVVSLSLQSDNFSKSIKSVQGQIKEVESRFQAAGAGVDNFANKTDGLKAKAGMLADKLRMQGQVTQQYERALTAANATLQRNVQTQQNNRAKLDAAKKSQSDLNKEVERAKVALSSAEKAYGKNSAVANSARESLEDLKEQYAAASQEVKDLEGKVEAQNKTLQRNADQVTNLETALNKAKAAEAATKAELEKTNRAIKTHQARWEAASKSLKNFGDTAKTAGQNMSRAGQLLTASITAPLVALGGYAVKASIDAESAFAGVRKTVDMTEEEFARLDDTITKMTTTKPAAYSDVAALAETGGQLGIANENLEVFVSTMTDLGVATNLVGQEGAAQLAKFANITGMSQGNFDRLGATIVDLGNNMATTEADIMDMGMRLAAAGSQVGLTEPQILGLSAALSSVGIEAQAGGSAFSKAMIGMELAVVTGKNGLKDYAKVAGMSSAEFQKAWKDDAAGAMQAFIVGLSKMDEEGISTIKVLDDMGFSEVRLRDTLMRATNASGLFANAQKISSAAWKENTALTDEASKRYATTESRLTMLKNRTTALARTFGNDLSPAFGDIIDKAGEWIDGLAEMDAGQRQTILTTAALLAAIGPGIMLIGKMNTGIGNLATGLGGLMDASVKAGGGLKGLFAATGSLLGPAGIMVLAGAALYGAAAWIDYASGAKAAREATEAMMKTAEEWKNTQAKTIFDTGNDPLARFGLSKESFSGGQDELEDWLGHLTETWTDGKKETNEIVKGYVDEFTSGTDKIREAIKERQKTQEKYGVTGDKATEDDLAKLADYDKEVEKLLQKRKNGKLTEDDQKRLQQVIQERVELQLKYTTGEGGGYSSLVEAVEAEKARLASEGKTPGADLYGDALTGAAQGYQTQVDAINQSYRDQYADIMAITDEKEREAALTQLNTEHTLALKKAQEEYNAVVGKYAPEAFETPEIQEAADDMEELKKKLAELQSGEISATAFEEFTKTLDEGKLASYLALLKQMQESGGGDTDLGDGSTANKLLTDYQALQTYLDEHPGLLTGLGGMLGATGEEANRVLVDMALTPDAEALKAQLEGWIADGIDITAQATITGYEQETGEPMTIAGVNINPETGRITGYMQETGAPIEIDGVSIKDETGTIIGYVEAATVTKPTPTIKAKLTYDDFSGVERSAIDKYFAENPDQKPSIVTNVGFQTGWAATLKSAFDAGNVEVFGADGAKLDVTPEVIKQIGPTDIFLGAETAEDGTVTYRYQILPKAGTKEAVDAAQEKLDEKPGSGTPFAGLFESGSDKASKISSMITEIDALKKKIAELKESGEVWDETGVSISELEGQLMAQTAALVETLLALGGIDYQKIADGIATILAAMQSDEIDPEAGNAMLQPLLDVIRAADQYLGVGNDISAGIASGMKAYGWSGDATTLATSIDTAIRTATGSHSPATKYVPIGVSIAEGVAKGIANGTYKVENAMVAMAKKALKAAKDALVIESPSRLMRDEVGVMIPRGAVAGIEEETKRQQKAVQNAFRALVQPALAGAQGGVTTNSRVYHQNSTVSLAGANIVVRDQQDIRALALELNSLQIAQQRALGRVTR